MSTTKVIEAKNDLISKIAQAVYGVRAHSILHGTSNQQHHQIRTESYKRHEEERTHNMRGTKQLINISGAENLLRTSANTTEIHPNIYNLFYFVLAYAINTETEGIVQFHVARIHPNATAIAAITATKRHPHFVHSSYVFLLFFVCVVCIIYLHTRFMLTQINRRVCLYVPYGEEVDTNEERNRKSTAKHFCV